MRESTLMKLFPLIFKKLLRAPFFYITPSVVAFEEYRSLQSIYNFLHYFLCQLILKLKYLMKRSLFLCNQNKILQFVFACVVTFYFRKVLDT